MEAKTMTSLDSIQMNKERVFMVAQLEWLENIVNKMKFWSFLREKHSFVTNNLEKT